MAKTNGAPDEAGPQKVEKWAAIAGRWKFLKSGAKYLGPETAHGQRPLGLALGSPRFRDGTIQTWVKLAQMSARPLASSLGISRLILPTSQSNSAGLTGRMPSPRFNPVWGGFNEPAHAGSVTNLSAESKHHLMVRVAGQILNVSVDEVDVLRYTLPEPLEGTGVGLSTWDDGEVEFSDTTIEGVVPRVFVIMPFSEPFDTLYRDVILPVSKDAGFDVLRVDEIHGPGIILDDIQQQIERSQAIVAEISTQNPNVFYELGYAHALRKPAVLLVRRQEGDKMPFDIRSYRAIFYDDSIGGKKTVETNLRQHLSAILRDS